ncbi:MAG: phosphoribosylamine--glycine ligase [Myxococcota bacterium]
MRVMVIGSGGREHALAWRIARSPTLSRLVVVGANPGWPARAVVEPAPAEVDGVVALARSHAIDLVVVGPETWLERGVADAVRAAGIACFGPGREAARIETSKAFAKEVMAAAGVPTAGALVVDTTSPADLARAERRCAEGRVVLKADGLAAGKGVIVCETAAEAGAALREMVRFGAAAEVLVLEDLLVGPEVSLFALSDGQRVVALPTAQDHKQLLDGGRGPNTGGMGAYAPCGLLPAADAASWVDRIHRPVVAELARRGMPFRGVLFAGLMLTPDGPRVLEFNARFGDPECQPLMVLWDDDLLTWLHGAAIGALPAGAPRFLPGAACCVVLAGGAYPESPDRGTPIPEPPDRDGVTVFHAGTTRDPDGALRTHGGRVLGVTGVGATLAQAREAAYGAVPGWAFAGARWRTDIGAAG